MIGKILIGIIIVIALVAVFYFALQATSTPALVTTSTPSTYNTPATVTTTPVAIIPAGTSTTLAVPPASVPAVPSTQITWCQGGAYADGSPIAQADAQIGAVVCGGGGASYVCAANGGWVNNGVCTSGMKGAPQPTWCQGGAYADGSPIPEAEAQVGMTVCGGGGRSFVCAPNGGWAVSGTCAPGMRGYIAPAPLAVAAARCQWLSNATNQWVDRPTITTQKDCIAYDSCCPAGGACGHKSGGGCYRWTTA